MGFFGSLFSGFAKSVGTSTSFNSAYRAAGGMGSGGGYGQERFRSIIEAHSSEDEIIEEFELDAETCEYPSLDGYENCWTQAYEEEMDKAEMMAEMYAEMGIEVDPEDLIDWDMVEMKAYQYAEQLTNAWISGDEWIPIDVIEWAFYDVSDHNG